MRKDNPAVFECPQSRDGLHTWKREKDRKATCVACKLVLNQRDADEVFET